MKYEKFIDINDDGTYSIPFSTKKYITKRSANAAISFYVSTSGISGNNGIARAKKASLEKVLNMRITYDDIYKGSDSHGFIGWNETIDYNGESSGGGFYRAFDGIWDKLNDGPRSNVYRTIGFLFYYRDDKGIKNLIDAIGKNIPNSIYDVLVNSLNNMDSDDLDAILEVYKNNNADEFTGTDPIDAHLSSLKNIIS